MYNSGYSQANLGLAAKKMHKSKGKSCGYYMKIVFFFSSLIQSLIIASLVLFLVYGQPEHTVEEKRLQELDQSVSKLTMENFILRGKEKNLTKVLNVTLTAKLSNDKVLSELRKLANTSAATIKNMQALMSRCEMEKKMPRSCPPMFCPDPSDNNRRLQSMLTQSEEMLKLVKANFTQAVAIMKTELDNSNKDKDGFHLEAIRLRRDKAFLEEELNLYQKKCKEDFVDSLRGIPNVTKEFLKRIDDLFSKHISFQLTCDKQKNQLEDIRENCSSLSREVENKLQSYLNIVGNQFTKINGENAKYVIENVRLKEDADWCNQNRSSMIRENRKNLEQLQRNCDQDSEKLLLENRKLKGDNNLNENLLSVKEKEIKMLKSTIETLNTSLASCKSPMQTGRYMPWPGTGSTGSAYPSLNGAGSSTRWGSTGLGATGSLSTSPGGTGTLSSGLGSTGLGGPGSSRIGLTQTGTSNLGGVGPGLTGFGSAGSSPLPTGNIGQSGTGSTAFSSAGSSGVGMAKPGIGGAGFGSVGSNVPGFGATLGGVRTTAGGSDSQTLNQAQIIHHLKELHRYSVPN
ncbi:plasmalemma vesicle associated protein a isoform X1 [Ctenopharyngodon idella]|uniref:plasmalemma vesicle associated protein a isoform X1 n=1 Tax=Ctenopharyngodon idella TaxID=7959 RepID=UPI002231F16E|nr:plasmalemma vesicle associated protein a isoform X1 [Ctenopharyngodon idella]